MARVSAIGCLVGLVLAVGSIGFAGAKNTDEIERQGTMAVVRDRGLVRCGVTSIEPGFAVRDGDNRWVGFDVDFCRAVAAALFGDPVKVVIVAVDQGGAYQALRDGAIDLVARHDQPTFDQAAAGGFVQVAVSFHDGLGLMQHLDQGKTTIGALAGAEICVIAGSSAHDDLDAAFTARNVAYRVRAKQSNAALRADYLAGRCDAYAAHRTSLAAIRAGLPKPREHVILPKVLSKQPQGPLIRQGDDRWADVVRWTLGAMLVAEERGVRAANVDDMRSVANHPDIRRLLGTEDDYGAKLGLSRTWAYDVIKTVGNYAEIYDRHLGPDTALALERGANALWSNGGILFAPPFR